MPRWILPFTAPHTSLNFGKRLPQESQKPNPAGWYILSEPVSNDWMVCIMPFITNLLKDRVVYTLVTPPLPKKTTKSHRLFLCTADPKGISFNWEDSADKTAYGLKNIFKYTIISIVWPPLGHRNILLWRKNLLVHRRILDSQQEGIERLTNLINFPYSTMPLLPYSNEILSECQTASAQGARYENQPANTGGNNFMQFREIFRNHKKCSSLIKVVEDYSSWCWV